MYMLTFAARPSPQPSPRGRGSLPKNFRRSSSFWVCVDSMTPDPPDDDSDYYRGD